MANSAPKTTQSATPYVTASASGGTFSLNSHTHSVTDNKHTHTFTPAGTVGLSHSSETTGSSTTGVTASSSTPSFTGTAHSHTFTGTSHGHSVNDASHSHAYDKTTSASFSGSSGTTGNPSTNNGGITTTQTTTSSTTPSYKVTDPSVSITDTGHNHSFTPSGSIKNNTSSTSVITDVTYSDTCLTFNIGSVAPVSHSHDFTGTIAYTDKSITGVTANASGTGVSGGAHTHSYDKTTGVTLSNHTHSFTPSGSVNLFYNYGNDQTTLAAEADGRVYTTASTSGISINATTAGGSISNTTAGGSISTPTITVKDPGHTHSYSYTSGASFTGTGGTTSLNASNISINSTTVTAASITQPTITVSGGAHTHEVS